MISLFNFRLRLYKILMNSTDSIMFHRKPLVYCRLQPAQSSAEKLTDSRVLAKKASAWWKLFQPSNSNSSRTSHKSLGARRSHTQK